VPPEMRMVPRFAAEPPQDSLPYGRWAARLGEEFLAACLRVEARESDLGRPSELVWFPDRTWHGRTYVPVTSRTTTGLELFGYVSFAPPAGPGEEPSAFRVAADVTAQTADANPDWTLDLCDEEIGIWRGEHGHVATMTLVWGVPLVPGGAIATAELADLAVDQCILVDGRFTLIAPDDYRADTLEVKLFDRSGRELARESLYTDEDTDDER
jgi:hypothetical protein